MITQLYCPKNEIKAISWHWITLTGPDCQDFLNRLTTVNLRKLLEGSGAPGCFLTAQGKIRSFFYLWNPSKDHYAFEFNGGENGQWRTALLSIIDQYTFGEKMTLADQTSSLKCIWIFPDEALLKNLKELQPNQIFETPVEQGLTDSTVTVCHHGDATYGRPWLTVWGLESNLEKWISKNISNSQKPESFVTYAELENWRIDAVQPQIDAEITEAAVPLEIGLRNAIADNKGCYPGQEVIEKIVALGSPAKRLVRIEGQGLSPRVGDRVQAIDPASLQGGLEIGSITSIQQEQNVNQRFKVLALLRKTHAQEGTKVAFLGSPKTRGTVTQIAPHA